MSSKEPENDPKDRWHFTLYPKGVTGQQVADHLKKIREEALKKP